jgi:hypothetical protein
MVLSWVRNRKSGLEKEVEEQKMDYTRLSTQLNEGGKVKLHPFCIDKTNNKLLNQIIDIEKLQPPRLKIYWKNIV